MTQDCLDVQTRICGRNARKMNWRYSFDRMIWRLWVDFHLEELKTCWIPTYFGISVGRFEGWATSFKAEQQLLQRIFDLLPDVVFRIVVLIFSVLFVKRPLVMLWETDVTSWLDDVFVTVWKKQPWSKKGWIKVGRYLSTYFSLFVSCRFYLYLLLYLGEIMLLLSPQKSTLLLTDFLQS